MSCEVQDCNYKTRTGLTSHELMFTDMRFHLAMVHPQVAAALAALSNPAEAGGSQSSVKAEKLARPNLEEEISEVDWNFFLSEWSRYKRSTGLTGQSIMDQLWACATDKLKKSCHQSGATDSTTEEQLLEFMKKLSIKATNKLVNVVQFLSLAQDPDEPVNQFISRLRGQSSVCEFEVKCSRAGCDTNVSYSDKMVSHQLVRGLENASVQEKVLALAATDKDLTLKKITEFVLAQETGTRSSKLLGEVAGIAKISDYKRGRSNTLPSKLTQDSGDESIKEKCHYCGKSGHGTRPDVKTREAVCTAWEAQCYSCEKVGHFKSVCRKKGSAKRVTVKDTEDEDSDYSGRVFSLFSKPTKRKHKRRKMKTLSHVAKNKFGQWVGTKPNPHPVVVVGISVSSDGYDQLEIPEPVSHQPTNVQAIADTGATVLVGGMDLVHQLRVKKHELIPVSNTVGGADHGQLELLGGLLVNVSLGDRDHQELCYIAKGVKELFLSGSTMKALGIISENFPAAGPAKRPQYSLQPHRHQQLHQLQPHLGQQFPVGPMFPVQHPSVSSGQFKDRFGVDRQLPVTSHYNSPVAQPAPPGGEGGGRR